MGPRGNGLKSKLHIYRFALKPHKVTDEKTELMYYQACLLAIELVRAAFAVSSSPVASDWSTTPPKYSRATRSSSMASRQAW